MVSSDLNELDHVLGYLIDALKGITKILELKVILCFFNGVWLIMWTVLPRS